MMDEVFDWAYDHGKAIGIFLGLCVFGLVVVLPVGITLNYYHGNEAGITRLCEIEDKESINKSDSHEYRVYTDCGNFVVEDEFWAGNFHASETYADLKKGKMYEIKTRGWRVPFFSMFPNIYSAKELS